MIAPILRASVIAMALCATSRIAAAFPAGAQFDLDPVQFDGAGGIAFDGAPRWTAHTCAVCHTNPPGIISIELDADHPDLFTTGYQPRMQYHLRVKLLHEWAGVQYARYGDNCGPSVTPYVPCDDNGFAIEVDDVAGKPQGSYAVVENDECATGSAAFEVDAYILKDGTAAVHSGVHAAVTQWDVCWTAPAAGTGTVTAFVTAVDGNGGDGTANFPNNTTGDDVAAGQVPIAEAGATAPAQSGGCSASGSAGALAILAIAAMIAAVRGRSMRARRTAIAATLAIAASTTACTHVRPRERETLAKRAMKFSPDPAEDELDLHMQEAREGSVGGYGTAGGGCGCN